MQAAFLLAFVHSLWALSVAFGNGIMDEHSFRQTQTAYSAFWLLKGGPFFAYETPLVGYPWSLPFELPVYQWLVAKLTALSGLPLEQAGRMVGRAFFYLSLWPLYSLARTLGCSRAAAWAGLTLYLLSPLYLYWSRTFLIESSALFFALAYAALFAGALARPGLGQWAAVAVAGALAGATKVTTAFAFFALAGLWWLGRERGSLLVPHRWRARERWLAVGLGFLVPAIATLAWVKFSDQTKLANPLAGFSTSASLQEWNFGTWSQRISGKTWYMFFRKTIHDSVGHRTTWMISLLLLAFVPRRWRLLYCAASLLFLLPPMTFTNLHIAHNYYWYANGIFLLAAFTFVLAGLAERAKEKPAYTWAFLAFFVLAAGLELRHFHKFQIYWQKQENAGPEINGRIVQSLIAENEVAWITGWGWYPAIPYYMKRRTIMDPLNYGVDDPRVTDSVRRTDAAGFPVKLLLVCQDPESKRPEALRKAQEVVEIEPANVGQGGLCEMYRVKRVKARSPG